MKGLEQLPSDLIIFKIAPLLKFEDYLSLRVVSKKLSNVFSDNILWKLRLKENYFSGRETKLPRVRTYCKTFIERKRLDKEFETLLVEEKVEKALLIITRERQNLLPGLLRIIERDTVFSLGLIYDAKQCIKIILGLEKLKLQRIKGKDKFVIDLLDMLEIEFVLDTTRESFWNVVGWVIDKAIEDLSDTRFSKVIREGRTFEAVGKVISKYFDILRIMEKWRKRWNKDTRMWKPFIADKQFHYLAVKQICLSFGIEIYKSDNHGALQIDETFSSHVSYIDIEFSEYEYQIVFQLEKTSKPFEGKRFIPKVVLLSSGKYRSLRNLEEVSTDIKRFVRESGNYLDANSGGKFVHDGNNALDTGTHRGLKSSAVLWMIRNQSFGNLGGEIAENIVKNHWVKKADLNPLVPREIGDIVWSYTGMFLVVFGYGYRNWTRVNDEVGSDKTGKSEDVCLQNVNHTVCEYLVLNRFGKVQEMESKKLVRTTMSGEVLMLKLFCEVENLGRYFSHYDLRSGKFARRKESKDIFT